jgi:predicted GTPase
MGYGQRQMRELQETIEKTACDVVVIATPVDLRRIIHIRQPSCRVTYELQEIGSPTLRDVVLDFLGRLKE